MQRKSHRRVAGGQEGQALIEAAFMLFFLSFFLMFLLWGRTLYENMARAQETLRYDLRVALNQRNSGMYQRFQRVEKRVEAVLEVPGTIGSALGQNPVRVPMKASAYGGTYSGIGQSEYVLRFPYRMIIE